MTSTRAIVRRRAGAALERRELESLRPGWSRVAIDVAGICRTDLYAAAGMLPVDDGRILGHEAAGRVMTGPRAGTRVVVWPYPPCGECGACVEGALCDSPAQLGVERDGLFSEVVDVPSGWLVEVPAAMASRAAAFVEPVAADPAVLDEGRLPLDRPGRVVGEGRIAALIRAVLVSAGATLSGPPHWVVETGDNTLEDAVEAVAPGGIVVLKSRPVGSVPLPLARAVAKRLTLRAVRHARPERALGWLLEHEVSHLWAQPHPWAQWASAFDAAGRDSEHKHFLAISPCVGSSPR